MKVKNEGNNSKLMNGVFISKYFWKSIKRSWSTKAYKDLHVKLNERGDTPSFKLERRTETPSLGISWSQLSELLFCVIQETRNGRLLCVSMVKLLVSIRFHSTMESKEESRLPLLEVSVVDNKSSISRSHVTSIFCSRNPLIPNVNVQLQLPDCHGEIDLITTKTLSSDIINKDSFTSKNRNCL